MSKTSIIFILPDLETGGAERVITTIANHLPRELFEPKILLMRKAGGYLKHLKEDVEIIDIKTQKMRFALKPILLEIIRRKPDIVFSGYGEINAYISLFIPLFPKTKFIARETNVVSEHVKRPEIRFFYRFYNNFHRIIAQSDDMKTDLIENLRIDEHKIVKINNPVDFDFIRSQTENAKKCESFKPDFKNVVAIGNLSARKGFDNLLKVFSHLKNEKILLHIVGNGRDYALLQHLRRHHGLDNVIFHGQHENPYRFLLFADLFVLSSRYEGFPNALLEAGACGTYALANNCPGGISEIIEHQINGEILDINQHEIFAGRIRELVNLEFDRETMRQSIATRFSKDFIMSKYENLILNIIK
ncbi:glycosyltransferase [Kaistella pullorum]|uniref:Glycosyltransferase n=1 Tax=Kaistella pullorum TaxID=2763074 RepID=A0ABR8WNE5_9FLAO|nr:glycosyltransferase [Kaistella pullorum]MBD8018468.1 glycosyltransferase [Kaistella pullorum]